MQLLEKQKEATKCPDSKKLDKSLLKGLDPVLHRTQSFSFCSVYCCSKKYKR